MRFKTFVISFAFLCGMVLLMFCGNQAEESDMNSDEWNQSAEEIQKLIDMTQLPEMYQAEFKAKEKIPEIADKIIAVRDELIGFFDTDLFSDLGDYMQRRFVRILYVNDVYRHIRGTKEFETYFKSMKEKKQAQTGQKSGVKLEFSIQSITVIPLDPWITVWDGKEEIDKIDMRIHVTFKYQINDRGEGDFEFFHRQGCPII